MNKGIPIKVLVLWMITMLTLAGCQVQPMGSTSKAAVRFEVIPSRTISVRGIQTYVTGEGLVIKGKVRRTPDNCCDTTRGAVSILLVSPDGEVIDTKNTSWTPRNIPKGRTRGSAFTATLPYVPTEDFSLRIAYTPD